VASASLCDVIAQIAEWPWRTIKGIPDVAPDQKRCYQWS